jgi:hypothetical protein
MCDRCCNYHSNGPRYPWLILLFPPFWPLALVIGPFLLIYLVIKSVIELINDQYHKQLLLQQQALRPPQSQQQALSLHQRQQQRQQQQQQWEQQQQQWEQQRQQQLQQRQQQLQQQLRQRVLRQPPPAKLIRKLVEWLDALVARWFPQLAGNTLKMAIRCLKDKLDPYRRTLLVEDGRRVTIAWVDGEWVMVAERGDDNR